MRLLLTAVAILSLVSPAYAQLAPVNDMGVTYGHVHLNVADVDASMLLFAEHFGGEIVVKGPLHTVKFPNFLLAFSGTEPTREGLNNPHLGRNVIGCGSKIRFEGLSER